MLLFFDINNYCFICGCISKPYSFLFKCKQEKKMNQQEVYLTDINLLCYKDLHMHFTIMPYQIRPHINSQKICNLQGYLGRVKRICAFEHSVMTNFNCAYPAIQRGYGSGFLSEGSSWLTACMSEQRRFWRDCADAQARLNLRCSHRR